jgi:hypothetical protein
MFIAFNNLPHCAPTERHVLCITESYKHLAPTEQSTNNQVQNTVCVLPGLLYLVFVFAPEEQHVYSIQQPSTLRSYGAPCLCITESYKHLAPTELVSRVVEIHLAHPRWSSLHSFVSGGDSDRVRFVL